MTQLLALAVGAGLFGLAWYLRGGAAAALLAMLAGCALTAVPVVVFGDSVVTTTIAEPTFTLAAYHLALLGGLFALPFGQIARSTPIPFVIFLVLLTGVVFLVLEDSETHVVTGVVQWVSAVAAWGIGGAIGRSAVRFGRPPDRLIAIAVTTVVAIHTGVAGLQLLGLRSLQTVNVGPLEVGRVSGLAGHSGNLGKVLFFLIMILLPLALSSDRVAKYWAIAGVGLATGTTALTYSRANTVSVIVLIGLFLLLAPDLGLGKRLMVPLVVVLGTFPVLDILLLRSEYDPEGGSRPQLLTTAMYQISETLWWGVGPNNYLRVVGQYDRLAAGGLPVHSAFLLALAEVGLICLIFLLIPFLTTFVGALAALYRGGLPRLYGAAILAGVPGIVVVVVTGWGLLREQFLILFFFVLGYLVGAMRQAQAAAKDQPAGVRARPGGRPKDKAAPSTSVGSPAGSSARRRWSGAPFAAREAAAEPGGAGESQSPGTELAGTELAGTELAGASSGGPAERRSVRRRWSEPGPPAP